MEIWDIIWHMQNMGIYTTPWESQDYKSENPIVLQVIVHYYRNVIQNHVR